VAQVDAFSPALRQATVATLDDIAGQCDAVRCDMAMLLMNDVFARTWGQRVGRPPAADFWPDIIGAVRDRHPWFGFVAEAYWNTEAQLAEQGFDYCYDKGLYDRLVHGHAPVVRAHLEEDPARQARAVHFVENHDEARAATAFAFGKERAAALAALTVPGARLFHRGQLEGCRIKVPVQLGRWPDEPEDAQLTDFYRRLLGALREPALAGAWALCDVPGWHGHQQHPSILAWCWRKDAEQCLVVVNLAGHPAQARVRLPWHDLGKRAWRLRDSFADATYDRAGDELAGTGLYVDLRGWGFHFLRFEPIAR
jgi:hypothetical protein